MKHFILCAAIGLAGFMANGGAAAQELTVYSGRAESFAGPLFKSFEQQTGIRIKARYASTAEIAALLHEEGDKSPADVFLAQDAGALIENAGQFVELPQSLSESILPEYHSPDKTWIGTSGRARVLAYSPERVPADKLPKSVHDVTGPEWKGKVGFAPKNASFQAFITAMREVEGEQAAHDFVEGLVNNGAKTYANNTAQVQAIADGEIDLGLINTYYLTRFKLRDAKFPVEQTFFDKGDIGNLLFVSGVGILKTSKHQSDAEKFVEFLLSPVVQQYFATTIGEYPVIDGIIQNPTLTGNVASPREFAPAVPLEKLGDVEGTKKLLTKLGLL